MICKSLSIPTPLPRSSAGYCTIGSKLYIFGGRNLEQGLLNELWCFDMEVITMWIFLIEKNLTFTQLHPQGEIPPARSSPSLAAIGNKLYMYGGGVWDTQKNIWPKVFRTLHVYDIGKENGNWI